MDRDDANDRQDRASPTSGNGSAADAAARRRLREPLPPRPPAAGRPTEDEEMLNRAVPSTPRAKAPELAAFTHSDPWRVLRIQGEFVHAINALADVGAAVAVFGSARPAASDPYYEAARELGRKL